jgi:hypothetical protein
LTIWRGPPVNLELANPETDRAEMATGRVLFCAQMWQNL